MNDALKASRGAPLDRAPAPAHGLGGRQRVPHRVRLVPVSYSLLAVFGLFCCSWALGGSLVLGGA
eukprot:16449904-Heterocapsa_arctica.AAC.1